jgi:flagellar capping protein FliD
MRWKSFALIFLLACAAFSWAQESSEASGSTGQDRTPQPSELSSVPTSLLWQIGSDALQSSMNSLQTQNETLTEAQSLQPDLMSLSLEMQSISQRLETKMSALSLNFAWLSRSMTSYVNTTTQAITQLQKQANRQNIELWIWRTATLVAVGSAVYFAVLH